MTLTTSTPAPARGVRRLAGAAVWVVVLAAAGWWIFYIPPNPLAPLEAIPDNAWFVHVSEDPGVRWAAIRDNPLLPACLSSNVLNTINRVAQHAGVTPGKTESRIGRTVFAYVPPSMRLPAGGWFAAAWLGSRAHAVRWWLTLAQPHDWQPLEGCGGRAAWSSREPVDDAGHYLSLSVADGVIVLCLSRDSTGIRLALAAHDKLSPSLASSKPVTELLASGPGSGATEQGWVMPPRSRHAGAQAPPLHYALTRVDSAGLDLTLRWDEPLPVAAPLRPASDLAGLARLAGANPALVAMGPIEALTFLSKSLRASAWSFALITLLQSGSIQTSNAPLLLAISTGTDGAGFGKPPLRMPLPAALMAAPLGSKRERLPETLDIVINILNARYEAGLMLAMESKPGAGFFCQIQAPAMKSIIKPADSDLPAIATAGDWLIAGSSGSHLASRIHPDTTTRQNAQHADWEMVAPKEAVSSWVWTDLEQMGKAVEDALALWRAILIWQGADRATLLNLARIKAITHALRDLGAASLTARVTDTTSEWRLCLGRSSRD